MWETFAKILGRHTASILAELTDQEPKNIQISRLTSRRERGFTCELAVSINFDGLLAEAGKEVGGYMVCGAVRSSDIQPLLKAMAGHLGLDPAIMEAEGGPQNLLNEFLNIVIGQTGAGWAEQGFYMNFSPPHILRTLPPHAPGDRTFHLHLSSPDGMRVDLLVVFNYLSRPVISE